MDIQKNAAAYNNVGHILKTSGQPLSATAIMRHSAIAELGVGPHIVRDALKWYNKHRYVKKLPRQWTPDDTSRYQWEWSEAAKERELPDHSQRKPGGISAEGRENMSKAAKRRWKKLKALVPSARNLGDVKKAPKVRVGAVVFDNPALKTTGNGAAEEKYQKIGNAFEALSGVKLTTKQVHAFLEIAVLVERGV